MLKQCLLIIALVYLAFMLEFVLFNAFGVWGKPALLILVIIFCGLYWGVRHSLGAAFVAGIIKGAFGLEPFGTYIFIYFAAAYLTTFFRRNIYKPGSRFSRVVVTFCVLISVFILELLLQMRLMEVRVLEAIEFILVPQLVLTIITATFIFQWMRQIALRLKL